jgi:hypothetical protein
MYQLRLHGRARATWPSSQHPFRSVRWVCLVAMTCLWGFLTPATTVFAQEFEDDEDAAPIDRYVIACEFHGVPRLLNSKPTVVTRLGEIVSVPIGFETKEVLSEDETEAYKYWTRRKPVHVPGTNRSETAAVGFRVQCKLTQLDRDTLQLDVTISDTVLKKVNLTSMQLLDLRLRTVKPVRSGGTLSIEWRPGDKGKRKTWIELKPIPVGPDQEVVEELVSVVAGKKIPPNAFINDKTRRLGLVRQIVVKKQPQVQE